MNSKANTEVYGLILSGGESSRMGEDKGRLVYHKLPQEEHLFEMLVQLLPKVYLSKKKQTTSKLPVITDKHDIESPLNGILSAFEKWPAVAWLIISCDMPLIKQDDIYMLLEQRSSEHFATCYLSDDHKPHPLFAIYEPEAYPRLKAFSKKNISPRQFLIENSTDTKMIAPVNDHLRGANTPEERHAILDKINELKGKM